MVSIWKAGLFGLMVCLFLVIFSLIAYESSLIEDLQSRIAVMEGVNVILCGSF
jgi:hypothetical protein